MSIYKDEDKLIQSLKQLNPIGDIGRVTIEECIAQIKYADPADVRPNVHGEWKQIHTYQIDSNRAVASEAQCTKCRKYSAQIFVEGLVTYEFCPRCGAKMDRKRLL